MRGIRERPLVRVQLERGEVREPDQRRDVVDDAAFRSARRLVPGSRIDPFGMMARTVLLEEPVPGRTVRRPNERGWPPGEMSQQPRCNAAVVVDDIGLAEPGRRIQDL